MTSWLLVASGPGTGTADWTASPPPSQATRLPFSNFTIAAGWSPFVKRQSVATAVGSQIGIRDPGCPPGSVSSTSYQYLYTLPAASPHELAGMCQRSAAPGAGWSACRASPASDGGAPYC